MSDYSQTYKERARIAELKVEILEAKLAKAMGVLRQMASFAAMLPSGGWFHQTANDALKEINP